MHAPPPWQKHTGVLCSPGWARDLWRSCSWIPEKHRFSCGHSAPDGAFPHAVLGRDYPTSVAAEYCDGLVESWADEIASHGDDCKSVAAPLGEAECGFGAIPSGAPTPTRPGRSEKGKTGIAERVCGTRTSAPKAGIGKDSGPPCGEWRLYFATLDPTPPHFKTEQNALGRLQPAHLQDLSIFSQAVWHWLPSCVQVPRF